MIAAFRALPYQRQVLITYIAALFMTIMDGTMVNVALPTMSEQFGVAPADAEFVAVGYLLAVAGIIPAAGWLGDRFGTRRVFLIALVVFTIASMLCGLAQSLDQLIAFRVLQGMGGGLLPPIGSTILFRAFPLNQRATAAAAVMSTAVVAPATGPVIGGVIVDNASWQWIFYINLPIGILAVTFGWIALRPDRSGNPGRFDAAGLVLSAGSISALIYGLSAVPDKGMLSTTVVGFVVGGVVGLTLLVIIELRRREPMLALRLLHDRLFRTVNLSASLVYAGFFGMIFILPIYMQELRGFSASVSGLVQAPQAFGILIVSNTLAPWAYRRIGPRRLMMFGAPIIGLVTCLYATMGADTSLWVIAGISLLRGLATGFVFISIQTSVYSTTSHADTGRAASLFNTQRQMSYAVGVALAATVLSSLAPASESAPIGEQLVAHRWAFIAVGVLMIPSAFWAARINDDDVAETRGLEPVAYEARG